LIHTCGIQAQARFRPKLNVDAITVWATENHLLLRLCNECDTFGFAFVSSHHAGQAS
jgi:hypothetical protein